MVFFNPQPAIPKPKCDTVKMNGINVASQIVVSAQTNRLEFWRTVMKAK